jgi:predicted TIM-barrel fold metal-dependent hydrolase
MSQAGSMGPRSPGPLEATTPDSSPAPPPTRFTDTHVHFWDRESDVLAYAWLEPGITHPVAGDYEAIKAPRYSVIDFLGETRFVRPTHVVHVQCAIGTADPVAETRWLDSFRELTDVPLSLVAYADLTDPLLEDVLDRQLAAGNVTGIRDLRYDDYLEDPRWRTGYERLAGYELVFCDDPSLTQMQEAARLAASHPGMTYCVDHAGFPVHRDHEYFEVWKKQMRLLAAVENTVVKISGLGMADHLWTAASIDPWVLACVEMWGVERVVFGSNWPCDRMYSAYGDVWTAYASIIKTFSRDERDLMLWGNADRLFGFSNAVDLRTVDAE